MALELVRTAGGARVPPHDLEAEKAALGAVLIKPAALDELADLSVDDFFLPAHREVFSAMLAIDADKRAIDTITLADELKADGRLSRLEGGEGYLLTLANALPTAENVRHYVRLIADKSTLRKVIAATAEIQSVAYGDVREVEEFLAETRARVSALEQRGRGGPVRIGDELRATLEAIENRGQEPKKHAVQTGIAAFDERIGGLRAGELVVVAANPGRGKTAWAWSVAVWNSRHAVPVLVFSLEMTRRQLIERSLASEGRVNGANIVRGRVSGPEWMRLYSAEQRLHAATLWIDDRNLTAKRICSEARRWRSRNALDKHMKPALCLVVIDYLGLVESEMDERTREREVAKMSRAFKLLAKELDAPVLLVSQLNRDNEKRGKDGKPTRPKLSDLRDSGAVEADADMVVFPWWETEPPLEGRHPASLDVAKHRNGPKGSIPVDWLPEFMTFVDCEENQENPQEGLW